MSATPSTDAQEGFPPGGGSHSLSLFLNSRLMPWRLRFDPEVEARYQSELVGKTLAYWRFTLVFGCILVMLFAIWDAKFFADTQRQLLLLRLGIVTPILIGSIILSFRARMNNSHLIQGALVAATWLTGSGVTVMMGYAAKPLAYYVFFPGVMISFIYMAALMVACAYVLSGGLILLATYIALSYFIGTPMDILGMSLFFLLSTFTVALFSSYEMERFKRGEFSARLENERLLLQVLEEKRQVDRANAAKSRFLAAASHDLRQPVQAVSNFVSVLSAENKDKDAGYLIGRIQASLQSLDDLFLALLDISRLDAYQVEPKLESFALTGLLDLVHSEYVAMASDRKLRLRVSPCRMIIRSDVNLLQRVLRNLVNNALLYTHDGGVLVGCRRRDGYAAIQVWDSGPGISEKHRDLVFQEFYQIDNPERDRRKGLGLGLSIVKRLCALLGHELRLQSMPGRGSMFEVLVPLSELATDDVAPGGPMNGDVDELAGMVVLVIEDEKDVRESYAMLFEKWGCFAITSSSGADALDKLQSSERLPDLVIADFRLRDHATGADAIRQVRLACEMAIPGLLVTGDTAPQRIVEARDSGFALLHKPLRAQQLREALLQSIKSGP